MAQKEDKEDKKKKKPQKDANGIPLDLPPDDPRVLRAQLKAERKALRDEEKEQRKARKARADEIAERKAELDGDDSGGLATLLITIAIIFIWLIIMGILIKLDVGGFGSNVLAPIIRDVPGLNQILPEGSVPPKEETVDTASEASSEEAEEPTGLSSIEEANIYIKRLENELKAEMERSAGYLASIEKLEAEVDRLEPFEREQQKLQQEKEEFYNSIVFGEDAPDPEAYRQYYELIQPDIAASIYAQIIQDEVDDSVLDDYVKAYSSVKAKEAAAIFDQMIDDDVRGDSVRLVSRILGRMSAENRGDILAKMDGKAKRRKV